MTKTIRLIKTDEPGVNDIQIIIDGSVPIPRFGGDNYHAEYVKFYDEQAKVIVDALLQSATRGNG